MRARPRTVDGTRGIVTSQNKEYSTDVMEKKSDLRWFVVFFLLFLYRYLYPATSSWFLAPTPPFRSGKFQILGSRVVMVWRRSQEDTPRQVPVVCTFTPALFDLRCMV